jgi:hypothetical protein
VEVLLGLAGERLPDTHETASEMSSYEHSEPLRRARAAGALRTSVPALAWLALVLSGAFASLLLASTANAQPFSSRITIPAGITYPFGEPESTIAIGGTTDIPGEVEIRCYLGVLLRSFRKVAEHVEVTGERFSTEVPVSALGRAPCQLRAVPVKYLEKPLPLGEETEFEGPLVVPSRFEAQSSSYFAAAGTLASSFSFEGAGTFALESELFSPSAHEDMKLFFGDANLSARPFGRESTRSGVQVDGADAFLPTSAQKLETELKEEAKRDKEPFAPLGDMPSLTVTRSYDEATHTITIHEEDPLVRCVPSDEYPATVKTCTGFVAAGVSLMRTWQTTGEDRVAQMSDTWRSTDGLAHTVSVRYQNELTSQSKEGAAYEFPEEAAFAQTHAGESKTLPAAGLILYKSRLSEPEAGDGVAPQGAIVYASPPSEPLQILTGTAEPGEHGQNQFELPYEETIPAGGTSATVRIAFVQGFGLAEVRTLAEEVLASYLPSEPSAPAPAPPAPPVSPASASSPPRARAAAVGLVSGAKGKAAFTLSCSGATGTSCAVQAALTTVEHKRKGHLLGIAAKAKTTSVKVPVGGASLAIEAGHRITITITLNATGRELLERFGKLPVHLNVTSSSQGATATVIAQNLVIKPAPKPRKKRHRH